MGLHRDPSTYSSNPVETQVRRLIWYQICFLDLRTCEATGPRPQIRRDEYDTRFPLNIDDDELERAAQRGDNVTQDSKKFTLMTITRMRAECFELYRMIWTERPKLQRKAEAGEKKTTLTGLLGRIQSFRAAMEKAYLPMMMRDNPLHAVAMEMYGILSSRLYLATLHPFASSDKRKMPERLRQIMISSCIMIVEHSMLIDQQPALTQWSWYVGALHQYHSAMYVYPIRIRQISTNLTLSNSGFYYLKCMSLALTLLSRLVYGVVLTTRLSFRLVWARAKRYGAYSMSWSIGLAPTPLFEESARQVICLMQVPDQKKDPRRGQKVRAFHSYHKYSSHNHMKILMFDLSIVTGLLKKAVLAVVMPPPTATVRTTNMPTYPTQHNDPIILDLCVLKDLLARFLRWIGKLSILI